MSQKENAFRAAALKPNLQSLLTEIQHDCHDMIVSTLHVHLDHDNCLEVLVVKGRGTEIRAVADRLITAKGVKHGKLSVTATGREFVTCAPHTH